MHVTLRSAFRPLRRDKRALSEGMRSVAIRIALAVNELVGRRGRLWADRWHGRALTSPRAVRNALVYVLSNFSKHAKWLGRVGWRRAGLLGVDEARRDDAGARSAAAREQ